MERDFEREISDLKYLIQMYERRYESNKEEIQGVLAARRDTLQRLEAEKTKTGRQSMSKPNA